MDAQAVAMHRQDYQARLRDRENDSTLWFDRLEGMATAYLKKCEIRNNRVINEILADLRSLNVAMTYDGYLAYFEALRRETEARLELAEAYRKLPQKSRSIVPEYNAAKILQELIALRNLPVNIEHLISVAAKEFAQPGSAGWENAVNQALDNYKQEQERQKRKNDELRARVMDQQTIVTNEADEAFGQRFGTIAEWLKLDKKKRPNVMYKHSKDNYPITKIVPSTYAGKFILHCLYPPGSPAESWDVDYKLPTDMLYLDPTPREVEPDYATSKITQYVVDTINEGQRMYAASQGLSEKDPSFYVKPGPEDAPTGPSPAGVYMALMAQLTGTDNIRDFTDTQCDEYIRKLRAHLGTLNAVPTPAQPATDASGPTADDKKAQKAFVLWWAGQYGYHHADECGKNADELRHWIAGGSMANFSKEQCDALKVKALAMFDKDFPIERLKKMTDQPKQKMITAEQWTEWGKDWSDYHIKPILDAYIASQGLPAGKWPYTLEKASEVMQFHVASLDTMPTLPDSDFGTADDEPKTQPSGFVSVAYPNWPESPVVVYPVAHGSVVYLGIKFSVTLRIGGSFDQAIALMREFASAHKQGIIQIAPDCLVQAQSSTPATNAPTRPVTPQSATPPAPNSGSGSTGGSYRIAQFKKVVDEGKTMYRLYDAIGADVAMLEVRKPDIVQRTIGQYVDLNQLEVNTRYNVNWVATWKPSSKINPKNSLPYKDIDTLIEA